MSTVLSLAHGLYESGAKAYLVHLLQAESHDVLVA